MAGNPHPVFQDGVPVDKGLARIYLPLRLGNPDALRALDGSTFWLCYIQTLLAFFYRDTSDTTSEDNGKTVIVDGNAGIWKIVSSGAGVAIGAAGPLADRDAFDGEDPGFTYFGTDTELLYVRLSDGGWSDGSSIKGPEGERGEDGVDGTDGADGRNFEPDEIVADLAGRDAFDGEGKNFAVLVEADSSNDDLPTMYFKMSATSADWSGGFTFVVGGGGGTGAQFPDIVAAASATIGGSIAGLQVLGFAEAGDGGDAIYARAIAEPSHAGKFRSMDRYLPDGSTDPDDGGWWEIVGADLSPRQFGAVVDGVTDDAIAFKNCCEAVLAKGGGRVRLPEGTMRLKSTTALAVATGLRFVIEGTGTYASVLSYSDAATDGIVFASSVTAANQHPTLELLKFSIETSKIEAGTAITATWANNLNIQRPFSMDKVEIRQCITRGSDSGSNYGYWTRGVYVENARNSYIANSYFFGEMNLSPPTSVGIEFGAECTFFTLHNVLVLEASTGVYIGGTTEGVKMTSCSIVGCRYGVQHRIGIGAEPELVITGCDFNCANVGVWVENVQMVKIQGCSFFANSWLDTGVWPNWTGILIQGSLGKFSKIIGCTFTKENQRTGDITHGIDANGSGGSMLAVVACDFFGFSGNAITYGVIVRSGFTRVVVDPSCQFEYVTEPFNNSGSTSHRLCKTIGGYAASVASGGTVNFPNAFSEACLSVVAVHDGTNTALNVTVSSVTASGFVINHNNSGGAATSFRWIAVGY